MTIRFATLAAVSTKKQAESDQFSLEVQLKRSREEAIKRGWQEAVEPYMIPGESRTRWVDLKDAAAAMPALRQMLEDARAHKFDVLAVYDYNRFRDLLPGISKTLRHYKVQIFSVSQPLEPQRPEDFNPYKTDTAIQMEGMNALVSQLQINDLRRKYMEKMPLRATEKGLPVKAPFGYIQTRGTKTPPEQDVELCAYVLGMKDMFFAGQSTTQIAEYMETTGVRPKGKKWYPQTVQEILKNPFYAGIVRWGNSKSELDPLTGRKHRDRKINPDQIAIGKGLHVPLWDMDTHLEILAEFRRRGRHYRGRKTQTFTGLLTCGVCQKRLWVYYNSSTKPENIIWRCSSRLEHVALLDTEVRRLMAVEIAQDIAKFSARPDPPDQKSEIERLRSKIIDLSDQIGRINDAYEAGAYTREEMAARKMPLKDDLTDAERTLKDITGGAEDAKARAVILAHLTAHVDKIPAILAGIPQDVNYLLRKVLADAVIFGPNEMELTWK